MLRWFLVLFLFFSSVFMASANFACGEVNSFNYSSNWMSVIVNYQQNPFLTTSCEVSPSNNKYCCDPRAIGGVSWNIGKVLEAKILDGSGYFAEPVNITITGQGFDVFPTLDLKKAVEILSPNNSVMINNGSIIFELKSSYPYLLSNYTLSSSNLSEFNLLCNCTNQSFFRQGLESGFYNLEVYSTNGFNTFKDSFNFTLVDFVYFSRKISCGGCGRNYVPEESEVKVVVSFNSSHYVDSLFYDYFPSDWELLTENLSSISTNTHDGVYWHVQGSNFKKDYLIKSPNLKFPRTYYFISSLDSFFSEPYKIKVYFFFPFVRFISFSDRSFSTEKSNLYSEFNTKVTKDKPIVLNLDGSYVYELALFSNSSLGVSELSLKELDKSDKAYLDEFLIGSTVNDKDISHILIKTKVDKKFFIKNKLNFDQIKLYKKVNGGFELQEIIESSEDELNYYLAFDVKNTGRYVLMGENNVI